MKGRLNHDLMRGVLGRATGGAIPSVTDAKDDETPTKRARGGKAKVKGKAPKARLDKSTRGGLIKAVGERQDAKIVRRKKGGRVKRRSDGGPAMDEDDGAPLKSKDTAMDLDGADMPVVKPKPNPARTGDNSPKGAMKPKFRIKMSGTSADWDKDETTEPGSSNRAKGGKVKRKRRAGGGTVENYIGPDGVVRERAQDDDFNESKGDSRDIVGDRGRVEGRRVSPGFPELLDNTASHAAVEHRYPAPSGAKQRTKRDKTYLERFEDAVVDPVKNFGRAKGGGIHIKPSRKGLLHRKLGVPEGQKIPASKLAPAARSSSPAMRKEANFAKNAKKWDH